MDKPTVTVTPDDGKGLNKIHYRDKTVYGFGDTCDDALYHAIERIAELEAERDQLREQNAALAAHLERLQEAFDESMELHHEACAQDGRWPHDLAFAAEVWMAEEKPTVSLARRDAAMKESTARELAMKWPPDSVMRSRLLEFADEYRQQAEGDS